MTYNTVRAFARVMALVWALWWLLAGLADGAVAGYNTLDSLLQSATPGLVLLATALIAWRWERLGGTLLALAGTFLPLAFRFTVTPVEILTLSLPPMLAGFMLLTEELPWHPTRASRT